MKSNVYAAVLVIVMALLATRAVEARRPSWGGHQAIAVSPDGKIIAVGGTGRTLYIVDAETMRVTHRQGHGAQIGALAFNADGASQQYRVRTRLCVRDTRPDRLSE